MEATYNTFDSQEWETRDNKWKIINDDGDDEDDDDDNDDDVKWRATSVTSGHGSTVALDKSFSFAFFLDDWVNICE